MSLFRIYTPPGVNGKDLCCFCDCDDCRLRRPLSISTSRYGKPRNGMRRSAPDWAIVNKSAGPDGSLSSDSSSSIRAVGGRIRDVDGVEQMGSLRTWRNTPTTGAPDAGGVDVAGTNVKLGDAGAYSGLGADLRMDCGVKSSMGGVSGSECDVTCSWKLLEAEGSAMSSAGIATEPINASAVPKEGVAGVAWSVID